MRFLAPAALLFLLAFFAASEFALIRLRPTRVQLLEADGERGATAVGRLQRRLRRALVATQLGMTLALVALGWTGRGLAERWGRGSAGAWLGQAWLDVLVFVGLVVLATLLGGLLPKAWVLHRPEASALRLAPVLEAVMRSLGPLLVLLERLGNGLLRLLGLPRNWDELVPALSAGELETLIESNSVIGLMPDERDMLEGLFSLRDTQVREVMVPRSGMVTLPLEVRFAELMEAVHSTHHARFPVIGSSLDDVRGLLDLRRLAEPIAKGLLRSDSPLAPYVTPVTKVQETTPLAELLPVIRSGEPLLVVVDEVS
jgi:CBS domain containing-hemolysin-like protein